MDFHRAIVVSRYIPRGSKSCILPSFVHAHAPRLIPVRHAKTALSAKRRRLIREFEHLHQSTAFISWCRRTWWDVGSDPLTFDDWISIDGCYRSRTLRLPTVGDVMVPCVDMANHASGPGVGAYFDDDDDGAVILRTRLDRPLARGDEVTIKSVSVASSPHRRSPDPSLQLWRRQERGRDALLLWIHRDGPTRHLIHHLGPLGSSG